MFDKIKMQRDRFLVNIINERYKQSPLRGNEEDSTMSMNRELQKNKENIPVNTHLMATPGPKRLISSSEESFIDDSDTDPNYVRQKKKVLPRKVIPSPSSSSDNTSSNSSNSTDSSSKSSSSDSETETRAVTNTPEQPEPQNFDGIESMTITDTIIQSQSHLVSEVSNDQPTEEVKRGKKRLRRESTWKSNIAKALRNSGKAYQSLSKNKKLILERKVRLACGEKYRQHCSFKINEETRQTIFDGYWGLADLQRQREYLIRHMEEI